VGASVFEANHHRKQVFGNGGNHHNRKQVFGNGGNHHRKQVFGNGGNVIYFMRHPSCFAF